jgi:hypothetical protein
MGLIYHVQTLEMRYFLKVNEVWVWRHLSKGGCEKKIEKKM